MNKETQEIKKPTYEELIDRCDRLEKERIQRLHGEMHITEAKQRVDEELTRVSAVQSFVGSALLIQTIDELIDRILEAVIEAFECEMTFFMEYDKDKQVFKVLRQFGEEIVNPELPCSPEVFESKESYLMLEGDDLLDKWADLNLFNGIISSFSRKDSENKGVIFAGNTVENANVYKLFDESHLSSFSVLVAQAGSLWNNLILYQEIKEHHKQLKKAHDNLEKTNLSLSRFVPDDFLKYLDKKSIVEVELGDNIQKSMSVLFSDIRSFTSISEKMTPEETFKFINSYLKQVGPVIRKHNGFIDKYIGDAIMALFPDKASDAVLAAIDMRKELEKFNKVRIKNEQISIDIGTGIHIGNLMLGTIGEEKRMEGTVISDAVNLASRIEGLTKIFGATIVVSEQFLNEIEDKKSLNYRFIGKIQVKGKDEAISIFDVFGGDSKKQKELKSSTKEDFEKGLSLYHSKDFTQASVQFNKVKTENPDDKAAMLYLQRSAELMVHGVPENWDGTEEMTTK